VTINAASAGLKAATITIESDDDCTVVAPN
jgi:hypothetical protein